MSKLVPGRHFGFGPGGGLCYNQPAAMGELEHIAIIGGGGTGAALAHDLALRGFRVTLLEKGALLCGTTGRHHGMLHSGARYVLHDLKAARECCLENRILRRIAPQAIEPNGGLFVAVAPGDLAHLEPFLDLCRTAGIPVRPISADRARALEPGLGSAVCAAVETPDAAVDPWRLPMHFFAGARANGAVIRSFIEVTGLKVSGGAVTGLVACDLRTGREEPLGADLVVNAAGPWSGRIAALAGLEVPIQPGPGVMAAVRDRLTERVIHRLHPAGEGDILVPQRRLTILGTTAWLAEDPDAAEPPPGHLRRLRDLCGQLAPAAAALEPLAVWSASRPLLKSGVTDDPLRISRTFECLDHGERDGVEGLVTLLGGKATTMRAMAEAAADLVCRLTGRERVCRTRDTVLPPYRRFWEGGRGA